MAIFDWLEHKGSTRLEQSCRETYENYLDSPSAQMTIADARAAGWEDDRVIWEFHRSNWPAIVRKAAEQLGLPNIDSRVRALTETSEGRELAVHTVTEVFADRGFDRTAIDRAIQRLENARDDAGSERAPLRTTWPVGWMALVAVGALSVVVSSLWPAPRMVSWVIPAVAGWVGALAVALGLIVRRGYVAARWAGVVVCLLAGVGLLAGAVRSLLDGAEWVLTIFGLLGVAYLVVTSLLVGARQRPMFASRGDLTARALRVVAWAVIVYFAVVTIVRPIALSTARPLM